MNHDNHIHYLHRHEIDTGKWDRCVKNAPNGWLYARSFFLDGIGDWDALVAGDYDYILPLPKKRKFGIRYIYIPPFTGQLGIIGADAASAELTTEFIQKIPKTFYVVDLLMNEQNPSPPGISVLRRTNYILSLREDYAAICDRYTQDAKKNIRRTAAAGLSPCSGISMDTVIDMYRGAYGKKNRSISASAYRRFEALGEACIAQGNGFTIGIRAPDEQLLASAFFGKDDKRIYYILGAPTRRGRNANAVHCLVDEVIKKFAGTGLVFDFEGSDIPSVSQFYRKFSPDIRQYDLIRLDRLPGWLQKIRNKRLNSSPKAPSRQDAPHVDHPHQDPANPASPDSSRQNTPDA